MTSTRWPTLDFAAWQPTGYGLHRRLQIVGKYRLAASPWVNHSWHATHYVTPDGFTTGTIHLADDAVEWRFDLREHVLRGTTSSGAIATLELHAESVAEFHARFVRATHHLGVPVAFHGSPNEVPNPVPFDRDDTPRPWDRAAVEAFHGAMLDADRVFSRFRARYLGKSTPSHLFWGSLDLAVTRFSGRRAPEHPGGIPALPDEVTREAYSHEVYSAGFWPGGSGVDEAAFYAYAWPGPDGFAEAPVEPNAAHWFAPLGEFVLPYEAVRTADDPDAALEAFLQSTWEAAARLGRWPAEALERAPTEPGRIPPPGHQRDDAPTELTFDIFEDEKRGRVVAHVDGRPGLAEMTWSRAGATLMIIDHTEVDSSLRGRGLGSHLAVRAVAYAREHSRRIVPVCPYFSAWLERHPEARDLVHR